MFEKLNKLIMNRVILVYIVWKNTKTQDYVNV